ncbi:unnamed protein product [Gordionus sp. m RMFG-2023]
MVNTLPKNNPLICKSQQLMLDYGFIAHSSVPGCYNILPLGQRSLDKLTSLIDSMMKDEIGALKLTLTSLSSKELWLKSGRITDSNKTDNGKMENNQIFELHDKNSKILCLNPTHEEAICDMLSSLGPLNVTLSSSSGKTKTTDFDYLGDASSTPTATQNAHQSKEEFDDRFEDRKASPRMDKEAIVDDDLLLVYQMEKKFRDEPKPKLGLMRCREFVMKDCYGFHANETSAMRTYHTINSVYVKFLNSLFNAKNGFTDSESEKMDANHEGYFPVGSHAAPDYVNNATPNVIRVKTRQEGNNTGLMDGASVLSHEFHLPCSVGEDSLLQCGGCGAFSLPAQPDIASSGIPDRKESPNSTMAQANRSFSTAQNPEPNAHHFLTPSSIQPSFPSRCPECGLTDNSRSIQHRRVPSVELGHAFYLGTRFSLPFGLVHNNVNRDTEQDGTTGHVNNAHEEVLHSKDTPVRPTAASRYVHMTCYGIGVTRLLAAVVQHFAENGKRLNNTYDEDTTEKQQKIIAIGLFFFLQNFYMNECVRWPLVIAPFKVAIIHPKAGSKEEKALAGNENLARILLSKFPNSLKDDILCDDRWRYTVGRRLADMKRIGIPYIVLCGKKVLELEPKYEFWDTRYDTFENLTLPELTRKMSRIFTV